VLAANTQVRRSENARLEGIVRKELEITINPNGEVEIVTRGFKGKSCLQAVAPFEQVLGELKRRELTSEYYEQEETKRVERGGRR